MKRSKLLNLSTALANSVSSTRRNVRYFRINSTQVNRSSNFRQFDIISLPTKTYNCYNPFNFQQNLFFSSKPESFIQLVLSNDWSKQIENELEKLNPKLTHESVVYVLMNSNTNPQKSLDFFNWVVVKKGFDLSFTPYIILLRCLACRGFMSEFWNVFSEMKRKGFYLDDRVFQGINVKLTTEKLKEESVEWSKRYQEMVEKDVEKGVANEVLEVILLSDWGEEVECELKKKLKFKFPLTENFVLRIITELWKQPFKAFRFFEWIGSCGRYEHGSETYNAMADVLAHCPESLGQFWDFVRQMRLKGHNIDTHTFVRSCKSLPRKDAVELFEFMMDGPYKPSASHITSLLTRVSNTADPDPNLVYRVFNNFVNAGNAPTKIFYDTVHRVFCKLGKLDEAKKMVEDLRNSGFKPDNFTYSQEIFGLCRCKRFDEACKVLEQMEFEGCVPNVKTWTMLINGLCKGNLMAKALSCFAKMKEKNVTPDPETLLVLLQGFISENKVLDAYKFFTEFIKTETQVKPTRDTYNLMIENLTEVGKLEEALKVLSMMKKNKIRAFPEPITKYIAKCGTVADAKRLLMVLSPSVTSCIPVYKKIFEAFFEQGRYSDVSDLIYASPLCVREHKAIREMHASCQATPSEQVAKSCDTLMLVSWVCE
ncbi:pentatricopeptide repeat-containing protein At3g48250, chloroplastic-like isoform X2 [Silene latifolia]|uniref:pentatricopeptide repeat-containing protein At3g48250, chloroplastic-like isoform X2 n=1 Tax=Silene latifolia TaxID=37657 RepID=UPI003D785CD2